MILLPPALAQLRILPLLLYLPRFVWQSFVAGWDIAWRAFHPRMPLAPGFVIYPTPLEPGIRRNTFTTLTSLTPGTLPCDSSDGQIVYHVVDTQRDNRAQLQEEERYLTQVLARKTPQP
jgi:multicomponent Na+:H+ antiporter subunit E